MARPRLEIRCLMLKCMIQLIYQLGGFVCFFVDLIWYTSCTALCNPLSLKDFTFRAGTSSFFSFLFFLWENRIWRGMYFGCVYSWPIGDNS